MLPLRFESLNFLLNILTHTFRGMILLFVGGLLFFFLSTSVGFYFNLKREGKELFQFELIKGLLSGTMLLTVYLNLLSFFLPVDYILLIPVFLFSIYVTAATDYINFLIQSIKPGKSVLLSKKTASITLALMLVLALYTLVPPYNTDSSGYHFLGILWNEKYKAIPGLANLFPQFGYNSSFFVLSATFSFTDVVGQSIYPINWVLSACFYLWMLKKSFGYKDARRWIIWFVLVICLRQFPINLASPSADNLASILVFYILFTVAELGVDGLRTKHIQSLVLLACFAPIIKLSTVPLLLVGLVPFFNKRMKITGIISAYYKIAFIVLLILVPWVFRNIILSGYLVFPFPSVNLFDVDWKVPVDIAFAEKLHISQAPRLISDNWNYSASLPLWKWSPIWLQNFWVDSKINCVLVISAMLSCLVVLISYFFNKRRSKSFAAWLIAFVGFWFWILTSPDIRFGYHFALMLIVTPLLELPFLGKINTDDSKSSIIGTSGIILICVYYHFLAFQRLKTFPISQLLSKPLRSEEYSKNNDLSSFKYVMLNDRVKLYIHDSSHHSINAPLPSCSPYHEGLRLRGDGIGDGFMIKR